MALYSTAAATKPEADQAVIDTHPISSGDGRCVQCQVEGPCAPRYAALVRLANQRRLPRRRPGATKPELIGARRVRFDG